MDKPAVQGFVERLDLMIRARCPAIYVVTYEEDRLEALVAALADRQGKRLQTWTAGRGLYEEVGGHVPLPDQPRCADPLEVLVYARRATGSGIFLLKDLHTFFDDKRVVRTLRDVAQDIKHSRKTLILTAPKLALPDELAKELSVVDLPLPDAAELEELLYAVCDELRAEDQRSVELEPADVRALVRAAQGLTVGEAENAFAKAAVTGAVLCAEDVELVAAEKQQIVRKAGILDFHEADASLADVGGLSALKAWMLRRGRAWSADARDFGLPTPRGVLLLGVPGCGKSLSARAVAESWKLPLLHLDLGRVFAGLLGSSEDNMRRALATAEGVAPAVLWIDEIEKGLAGGSGSGHGDSGTAVRVFGTLLTWMQERAAPVFVVATANRIDALPPELLRRGRFDEIFFVDLPDAEARTAILSIHLRKRGREPDKFDLAALASAAGDFSGAELEHVVVEGLFTAFEEGRDLCDDDLLSAIAETIPLARHSAARIDELRAWARTHARSAS